MVPLRFTQIFAPLRSAKTSYSRGTLYESGALNWFGLIEVMRPSWPPLS